jgi:hypothetical protein
VRNGRKTFCRPRLRRLLLGALGGAACSGNVWAADVGSKEVPTQGLGDAPSVLRLSPQLGEQRKTKRSRTVDAWRPPVVEAPLSLSLTMLLKPEDDLRATVPLTRTATGAPGEPGAAGRVMPAGPRVDGSAGSGPLQPEAPVPFDPTPAVPGARRTPTVTERPAGSAANAADSGLPDLSGETWVMAPIRWAGNTSTSGNFFSSADDQDSWSIRNDMNVQANSFIGAPYIAQWSGLFGMNSTKSQFNQDSPSTRAKLKTDSSGTDIGGSINVFPVSRFPFSANFTHGTTEVNFGQNRQPITNTSYGLRQQYRTERGDSYSASYNSTNYSSGPYDSQSSVLTGTVSGRRVVDDPENYLDGEHNLNATVAFVPDDRDASGQKQRLLNANVSHTWTVHEDLSLSNTLTLTNLQQDQFSGDTLGAYDSRVLLATSNFTWRPDPDLPLTLNGGGSIVQTRQTQGGDTVDGTTLAANLSTNYRFNNNLTASGNAYMASTSSNEGSFSTAGAGVNASYTGDTRNFGDYVYSWNLGGGASGNYSSEGESFLGLNASVGQNLMRTLVVDQAQTLSLNASQTLSFNHNQSGLDGMLSHSFGAAWRAGYGEALTANLSANLSDNISTGESQDNHFTSLNLIGSAQYQISSRAALVMSVNLNWSQNFDGSSSQQQQLVNGVITSDSQSQWSGIFSLAYLHRNPFSILNLNYSGNLQWINSQTNSRIASRDPLNTDPLSSRVQESISFQQMLDYRIGRLTFRLNHAIIDQSGRKSASIFGSVNREFDGFFDGRW